MANLKLTNDYWETSGVYDLAEGKTQRQINQSLKAPEVPQEVTGDIAVFEGAEGVPLKSLVVNIKPVQEGSGDPSPTNVRPITGWTGANVTRVGKNLLPLNVDNIKSLNTAGTWSGNAYTRGGVTFTVQTNAVNEVIGVATSGTASENTLLRMCTKNTGAFLESGVSYTLNGCSANGSEGTWLLTLTDNSTNTFRDVGLGTTFTPDASFMANNYLVDISVKSGTNVTGKVFYPMLRFSSASDATYEPYRGDTYSISFPAGAGTVYGGTLDVTNGTLTIDRAIVDLGTLASGFEQYSAWSSNHSYRSAAISTIKTTGITSTYMPPTFISSKYKSSTQNDALGGHADCFYVDSGTKRLYISDSNYVNDTASFKTSLTGVQFVYPVVSPVTYTLTPTEVKTLLGVNNVWADCGSVDVQYGAYLTVIENQLGEKVPKLMIAPVLDSMTADTALVANDIRIVGDTLYRITTNVASGATLTVGTNCEVKTIGELLTSLLNA